MIMKEGKILAQGTISELVKNAENSNLEEAFLYYINSDGESSYKLIGR